MGIEPTYKVVPVGSLPQRSCPCSVRILGTKPAKTSRYEIEKLLLFSVISLVGFVRRVERNCLHNPKVGQPGSSPESSWVSVPKLPVRQIGT
jgi:hypothetical protein